MCPNFVETQGSNDIEPLHRLNAVEIVSMDRE